MAQTADLKQTPLYALHCALQGKMVPFAGYEMPVQYPAGILREHLHTREKAGLFDVSHMGQAFLRGDGAPIHSVDNSYYKAYSIASLGLARKEETTKQMADRMAKAAPTTVPQTQLPNITYAQGGIAIMHDGAAIAGFGVSGAPGGNFDEECARGALAKIKDRMK